MNISVLTIFNHRMGGEKGHYVCSEKQIKHCAPQPSAESFTVTGN